MILRTLVTSLALTFSTAATATTLTFDELGPLYSFIGSSYEAEGFRLIGAPSSPGYPSPDSQFRVLEVAAQDGTTSLGLFMGGPGSRIGLEAKTGALFNAISIDLDQSWAYKRYTEPVYFTAVKRDGTIVSAKYSFAMLAPKSETFVFGNEFRDIQSLQWRQGAIGHTFDNIVLTSSVPEPSTMWLFAPLVAGLSLWSRKRTSAVSQRNGPATRIH